MLSLLGSMGNADEEGLAALALEAARLTGVRMLLQVRESNHRQAPSRPESNLQLSYPQHAATHEPRAA